MSKIGKQPIIIPQGVVVNCEDSQVNISGPGGSLSFKFRPQIKVNVVEGKVKVTRQDDAKPTKALHGLTRAVIANMIKGVTDGHQKVLELVGVGYRAAKQGQNLILNVGFSHPVIVEPLPQIQIDIKENEIIISGIDKVVVGEMAAKIRRIRPPEPYKGKGIKYIDEKIKRKVGKTVKATANL